MSSGRFTPQDIASLRRRAADRPRDALAQYQLGLALARAGREPEAIPWFERAVALDGQRVQSWRTLIAALQSTGRHKDALRTLAQATTRLPGEADLHVQLGDLLHSHGLMLQARDAYARGATLSAGPPGQDILRAKVLMCEKRFAEAAECLRSVLARDSANLSVISVLGDALGYLGALEEAAALYERALQACPDTPWMAWHGLTRSRRIVAADRPLLGRLEDLLPRQPMPQTLRMRMEFALGKACDDLGEYDRAMRHFEAANRIRGVLRPFDRARFQAAIEMVRNCFTADFFAARQSFGSPQDTAVLIIGMPRSGTTLVEQILSAHPNAAGAGELSFWSQQTNALGPAAVQGMDAAEAQAIAAHYLQVLRQFDAQAVRISDKNPFNFHWIGLIRLLLPNAAIVHCRRDPIDTCLSNYITDFEMNWGFNSSRDDLVFVYRCYRRIMAHWAEVLPGRPPVQIDYERMTDQTDLEARRLVAGVGLEWDAACLGHERNPRSVQTASFWQVRQPVYRSSVQRWRHYEPWLGALRELEGL